MTRKDAAQVRSGAELERGRIDEMEDKTASLKMRLYLIAAIILLAGLGSSAFIYWRAEKGSNEGLVYQYENSKRYRHDVELVGGKASLLADDFTRWFEGLWHGRSLALTVACITVVAASGFFFVGHQLAGDE